MTPQALQHMWLPGVSRCIRLGQLVTQALPNLLHANLAASSQAWFSSCRASNAGVPAAAVQPAAVTKQQQRPKQQKQQEPSQSDLAAAAAAQENADRQLQLLKQQYQGSRMDQYYTNHLSRELILKLNVPSVNALPKVKNVDLSINARDTHGRRYAEKWEMLLPALALEYITGKPAIYTYSSHKYYRSRNAVTAVKVHLTGGDALDFLQKLIYLVLPSQNAFAGVTSRSLDGAGNLHFRLPKIINFPDFEEQFEIFENLQSLHVSINMANTQGHKGRSQLLMTGLQLPMLAKKGEALEVPDQATGDQPGAEAIPNPESDSHVEDHGDLNGL